jgi:c-di-GMP-related signal transduction protein
VGDDRRPLESAAPGPRWRVLGVTGLVRARTCEAIAGRLGERDPESYFLVGLLSVGDALLDTSLDALVTELPPSDEVAQALLTRAGGKGLALAVTEACERGERANAQLPSMDAQLLTVPHAAALRWSDAALTRLA